MKMRIAGLKGLPSYWIMVDSNCVALIRLGDDTPKCMARMSSSLDPPHLAACVSRL